MNKWMKFDKDNPPSDGHYLAVYYSKTIDHWFKQHVIMIKNGIIIEDDEDSDEYLEPVIYDISGQDGTLYYMELPLLPGQRRLFNRA
jgi:hypothetical protein